MPKLSKRECNRLRVERKLMESFLGGLYLLCIAIIGAMMVAVILGVLGAFSLDAFCWAETKDIC